MYAPAVSAGRMDYFPASCSGILKSCWKPVYKIHSRSWPN